MKTFSALGKLIVILVIAAAVGVIAFFVYVLVLRTDYRETALEINEAMLASGSRATVSRGDTSLAASAELLDYYNRFFLEGQTLVYSRKSAEMTERTIVLEFGDYKVSFTGMEDGTSIGLHFDMPEGQKDFRVRSTITFMQLEAYFDNYVRKNT